MKKIHPEDSKTIALPDIVAAVETQLPSGTVDVFLNDVPQVSVVTSATAIMPALWRPSLAEAKSLPNITDGPTLNLNLLIGLIAAGLRQAGKPDSGYDFLRHYPSLLRMEDLQTLWAELAALTSIKSVDVSQDIFQSGNPNRSVVELVSNALDASDGAVLVTIRAGEYFEVMDSGKGMSEQEILESLLLPKLSGKPDLEKTIGRFGIGFYTALRHLKNEADRVVVETKTVDGVAHELIFSLAQGQLRIRARELVADFTSGTRVRIYSGAIQEAEITGQIQHYLRYSRSARKILVNGQQVNHDVKPFKIFGSTDDFWIGLNQEASPKIVVMAGDLVVESYPVFGAGFAGEIIFGLPQNTGLSIVREEVEVDNRLLEYFIKLADLVHGYHFNLLGEKITFLNALVPLAQAFEQNGRNKTGENFLEILRRRVKQVADDRPIYPDTEILREALSHQAILVAPAIMPRLATHAYRVPQEFKRGVKRGTHEPMRVILADLNTSHVYDESQGLFIIDNKFYRAIPPVVFSALFKIPSLEFSVDWVTKSTSQSSALGPATNNPNQATVCLPRESGDPDFSRISGSPMEPVLECCYRGRGRQLVEINFTVPDTVFVRYVEAGLTLVTLPLADNIFFAREYFFKPWFEDIKKSLGSGYPVRLVPFTYKGRLTFLIRLDHPDNEIHLYLPNGEHVGDFRNRSLIKVFTQAKHSYILAYDDLNSMGMSIYDGQATCFKIFRPFSDIKPFATSIHDTEALFALLDQYAGRAQQIYPYFNTHVVDDEADPGDKLTEVRLTAPDGQILLVKKIENAWGIFTPDGRALLDIPCLQLLPSFTESGELLLLVCTSSRKTEGRGRPTLINQFSVYRYISGELVRQGAPFEHAGQAQLLGRNYVALEVNYPEAIPYFKPGTDSKNWAEESYANSWQDHTYWKLHSLLDDTTQTFTDLANEPQASATHERVGFRVYHDKLYLHIMDRKTHQYGVYLQGQGLIIPCHYAQIFFENGVFVLRDQNNKWFALSCLVSDTREEQKFFRRYAQVKNQRWSAELYEAVARASNQAWDILVENPDTQHLLAHLSQPLFELYVQRHGHEPVHFLDLALLFMEPRNYPVSAPFIFHDGTEWQHEVCEADALKTSPVNQLGLNKPELYVRKLHDLLHSSLDLRSALEWTQGRTESYLHNPQGQEVRDIIEAYLSFTDSELLAEGDGQLEAVAQSPVRLTSLLVYLQDQQKFPEALKNLAGLPESKDAWTHRLILNATNNLHIGSEFRFLRELLLGVAMDNDEVRLKYFMTRDVAGKNHLQLSAQFGHGFSKAEILAQLLDPQLAPQHPLHALNRALYLALQGAQWVRLESATSSESEIVSLELIPVRHADGRIVDVKIRFQTRKNELHFVGAILETRRLSQNIFLDATRARLELEEMASYLPREQLLVFVNDKTINQARPIRAAIETRKLGRLELFDGAKNKFLLGGLPIMEIQPELWADIPVGIRQFYERGGFYLNLDPRLVQANPTGNGFQNHDRVIAEIAAILPGLLLRGFLSRVADHSRPEDLHSLPQDYFLQAYQLASEAEMVDQCFMDAMSLERGNYDIDYRPYLEEARLIRLLSFIPFIPSDGGFIDLTQLHQLFQKSLTDKTAKARLDQLLPSLPVSLRQRIEFAQRSFEANREIIRHMEKRGRKKSRQPTQPFLDKKIPHTEIVEPFYRLYLSLIAHVAGCYNHVDTIGVNTLSQHMYTRAFTDGRGIYWTFNAMLESEAGTFWQTARIEHEAERLQAFTKILADILDVLSHELTHIKTRGYSASHLTHDVSFYREQGNILLDLEAATKINVAKLAEKFLTQAKTMAPPSGWLEALQKQVGTPVPRQSRSAALGHTSGAPRQGQQRGPIKKMAAGILSDTAIVGAKDFLPLRTPTLNLRGGILPRVIPPPVKPSLPITRAIRGLAHRHILVRPSVLTSHRARSGRLGFR